MTWFKVDDGFAEHPKLELLESNPRLYMAAITVWTIMGTDCARRLTDGKVTKSRLAKVLACIGQSAGEGAAALVECGLWKEARDGWAFHDWDDYQPPKKAVKASKKKKAARQRRWRDGLVDASTSTSPPASRDGLVDASTSASPPASTSESRDGLVDASTATSRDGPGDASTSASPPASRDGPGDASRDAALRARQRGVPSRPVPSRPENGEGERASAPSPSEVELEPNEPEPAAWRDAAELVRSQFAARYDRARGNPPAWSAKNLAHCATLGAWLDRKNGDHEKLTVRLLDGFFRDPWAASKGFPLGALANDPVRYFAPPSAPRDVRSGYLAPAPPDAFSNPTNLDDIFGPEASAAGE